MAAHQLRKFNHEISNFGDISELLHGSLRVLLHHSDSLHSLRIRKTGHQLLVFGNLLQETWCHPFILLTQNLTFKVSFLHIILDFVKS